VTVRRILLSLLAPAVVAALAHGSPAAAGPLPPPRWAAIDLAPGVQQLLTVRPGLRAHAARIDVRAPVVLRPVVAYDRIGGGQGRQPGRQATSDLCARAGGLVCVNGDFFNCGGCNQVSGGLVDKGRPLRSFQPFHAQVSVVDGRLTTEPIAWEGRLRGVAGTESIDLPLSSLNRGPARNRAVLYSPEWGTATPRAAGQLEVVLATGGPMMPGVLPAAPVARRPRAGGIPRDGVVVAANGTAAAALDRFVDAWRNPAGPHVLNLHTALSYPASLSVGAHPVLLRDGARQPLNGRDSMMMRRHPRTILGWTEEGDVLLVTIDGRWPGRSAGATLWEATSLLLELGAHNAVNLDGGGSSTFTTRCFLGSCVQNRPSDGRQRPVAAALAVVPVQPGQLPTLNAASFARAATADLPVSRRQPPLR
jgi:hypothetical protein